MRVIVLVKASAESESGAGPTTEQLTEMGAYNVELAKAGIILAGEGLRPKSDCGPRPPRRRTDPAGR